MLLATYNSERFLAELLDSLSAQTFRDFVLVVSDDCSVDSTLAILAEKRDRFAHPPEVHARTTPSGSAGANFASLLALSTGDVVFLADHDDVWMPEKIEQGLTRMAALSARSPEGAALLVHGDLQVVDAKGRLIAPSFWAYKSISPQAGTQLRTALMHPSVTGCTAVLNRPLVEHVRDIPRAAIMHDWWINLAACAFGAVDFDPSPWIKYRIHGSNVSAPKRSSLLGALQRLPRPSDVRRWIRLRLDQGADFLTAYRTELPRDASETLDEFVALRSASWLRRRIILVRGGFLTPDAWRNAAMLILI
ncbi:MULTISPECIES: glycosyltransferase family 2 protein [Microbacterium]|uniref:glycosyltransferase family 2 protein n=1 Tax=Microbacterium TaxID=33882 RepID=UPI0013A581AB|nr:glycosyltransferase family 2 protein [Microbacterium sp. KCTC 39802]